MPDSDKKNATSWKPGESGNSKGRPPGTRALSTRLREALEENDDAAVRWIVARLILQSAEGAVEATKLIFDRTEGKVPQRIIGDEEQPLTFKFVDPRGNSDSRAKPRS